MRNIKLVILILLTLSISFPVMLFSATLEVTNASISPGSNINNSTSIEVSITNQSNVDIKVYELTRKKRILVRNIMNRNIPAKSSFKEEWNGRNDNGDVVDNGNYEIELVLSDIAKPFITKILKKEVRVETYYIIEELKVVPTPFSPGRETATIFYQLSKDAKVALSVLDSRGLPVVHLIRKKKFSSGKNSISWNGKDENGWLLESGLYTCLLEVSISGRKEERKFPFRIVEGIEIKNLAAIPEKINPEGMNNYSIISFTMDNKADYSMRIYDAGGKEVWYSGINKGNPGKNSIVWGGLDKVRFKTNVYYKIKVKKKDSEGKTTEIIRNEKETLIEEMDGKNLKYKMGKNEGNPIIYSMVKTGEVPIPPGELEKKIDGIKGDIIETGISKIEIIYTSVDPVSLFSGKYTIEVSVKDPETKEISVPRTTTVTIDLEKPFGISVDKEQIKGVSKSREFFPKDVSSSMEKRFAEIVIPFELTKDANVELRVLSIKGGEENRIDMGRILAGVSEAAWNGTNMKGETVTPGKYRVKLLATETTLVKKPKTIVFDYYVYVREIPRIRDSKYSGTNVFYAFDMEKDYMFPSPVISSNDIFDKLVTDLDKEKNDEEGRVIIDFSFERPVAVCCIVVGEDKIRGVRELILKKEWLDTTHSGENNTYRWTWNGRKYAREQDNPFLYRYGINEVKEVEEKYVQSGLYQLWLFAVHKNKKNEKMLKEMVGKLAEKKQLSNEELQEYLEETIADKNLVFIKKELKGLGVFTELGLHIEGAINKGIAEFINYINKD